MVKRLYLHAAYTTAKNLRWTLLILLRECCSLPLQLFKGFKPHERRPISVQQSFSILLQRKFLLKNGGFVLLTIVVEVHCCLCIWSQQIFSPLPMLFLLRLVRLLPFWRGINSAILPYDVLNEQPPIRILLPSTSQIETLSAESALSNKRITI